MKARIRLDFMLLLTVIVLLGIPSVNAIGSSASGTIRDEKFEVKEIGEGFSVPMLSEEDGKYVHIFIPGHGIFWTSECAKDLPIMFFNSVMIFEVDQFTEAREAAIIEAEKRSILDDEAFGEVSVDVEQEIIEINNHPILIKTSHNLGDPRRTMPEQYTGSIFYARNNYLMLYTLCSLAGRDGSFESVPSITKEDLIYAAEMIEYDPTKAPITVADGEITISSQNGENIVSGGKKIKFSAAFANPEKVNKKSKNDTVEWKVIDPSTNTEPENAVIDKNGVLSVNKELASPIDLEVKASSPIFHTEATYQVTAIPALKKLMIEPANVYLYIGAEMPQPVKAIFEPETVPPTGLTWTAGKNGIVDIVPNEDGTADIKPLTAGKVTITVKAPGGKSAKLNISILEPVTGLDVSVTGSPKAGKSVALKATLEPKNAGNKTVEWSVDVEDEVATINQKGQLKIAKEVKPGTIITVTCRATGALDPIEKKIEIIAE